MSYHIENTICPKCREKGNDKSGNNLGVFSDGHCICWAGCGYYVTGDSVHRLHEQARNTVRTNIQITLPEDVTTSIPDYCIEWLKKYEITEHEVVSNKLLYSPYWDQLIFPYFDGNESLIAWQGRSFAEQTPSGRSPKKWFSQGKLHEFLHILPIQPNYDRIVLVEDVVSAIKVSRYASAMPLFGCKTGLNRLQWLSRLTPRVTHWLDPDKRKEAFNWSTKASLFGMTGDVIFSTVDPKECSDEEIKSFLK